MARDLTRHTRRIAHLVADATHTLRAGGAVQVIVGRLARTGPAAALPAERSGTGILMWPVDRAAEWLRTHAGVGGTCAAHWLNHPPESAALWTVNLHGDWFHIAAVDPAGRATASATRYDGLNTAVRGSCSHAQGPGSASLTVGGNVLVARAQDQTTAALGAGLAYAAGTGRLPRLDRPRGSTGRKVELPVGDAELSLLLERGYAAHPAAVVAAIRALRRLGEGRDRRLMSALDSCPGLLGLRDRVAAELAGAGDVGADGHDPSDRTRV